MKKSGIHGFRVKTCFGGSKCPNRIYETEALTGLIADRFEAAKLLEFLRDSIQAPLKHHHEFKVAIAGCPNACSRPQIEDIGILGAVLPKVVDRPCTGCEDCVVACKEQAITLDAEREMPVIDFTACVQCGVCVKTCPAGTLVVGEEGFRFQVGGKLGRKPQLAMELPGLYKEDQVVSLVDACIALYKKHAKNGERFGSIINRSGLKEIINHRI
jgi:dissimilatory sulfite reductase (desulfoviridin) alpha/beta subunit